MKRQELEKILKQNGFRKVSENKHIKYKKDQKWTVISKGNKEIPKGTLKNIERQTGLKLL